MKKLLLSLLVAATAVSMSAFTNASSQNSNLATRYWGNNGTNYIELTSPPGSSNCSPATDVTCLVESTSTTIPSSFPKANPSHYPLTEYQDSNPGIYTAP